MLVFLELQESCRNLLKTSEIISSFVIKSLKGDILFVISHTFY